MKDETAPRTRSPWLAAALVGALSAVLGAITLSHKSLWYDEAYNGVKVAGSWHGVFTAIGKTEMSQSAYLVLLKPWVAITTNNEVWLRLPSVIAAALAAALLVPLGARLFDRTTGIVAGILLATNELLVAWSQQARAYALVTFAVVLASLLFVRALDDPRRRNWLLYAVAAAFAVYCHFWAGFVIVAHFTSMPFAPRRPLLRRVVEATVVFLALIAGAVYFTATAQRVQLGWIGVPSMDLLRSVVTLTSGHNVGLQLIALGGLVVLVFQTGAGTPAAAWRTALVGGWIALPIVLAFLVSEYQPILVPRYAIVITPALALAGAVLLATVARMQREVAAVALVVVVGLSAWQLSEWYRRTIEDWRSAVAYVDREKAPGDTVVVAPKWATDAFHYYDPVTRTDNSRPTGRTFVLLRIGRNDGDGSDNVYGVLGPTQLELTRQQRFGERLWVQVLDPP
jgi:mannosyltransferase